MREAVPGHLVVQAVLGVWRSSRSRVARVTNAVAPFILSGSQHKPFSARRSVNTDFATPRQYAYVDANLNTISWAERVHIHVRVRVLRGCTSCTCSWLRQRRYAPGPSRARALSLFRSHTHSRTHARKHARALSRCLLITTCTTNGFY